MVSFLGERGERGGPSPPKKFQLLGFTKRVSFFQNVKGFVLLSDQKVFRFLEGCPVAGFQGFFFPVSSKRESWKASQFCPGKEEVNAKLGFFTKKRQFHYQVHPRQDNFRIV